MASMKTALTHHHHPSASSIRQGHEVVPEILKLLPPPTPISATVVVYVRLGDGSCIAVLHRLGGKTIDSNALALSRRDFNGLTR
jgi:hypothetical protein